MERNNYERMTVPELKNLARERGLTLIPDLENLS